MDWECFFYTQRGFHNSIFVLSLGRARGVLISCGLGILSGGQTEPDYFQGKHHKCVYVCNIRGGKKGSLGADHLSHIIVRPWQWEPAIGPYVRCFDMTQLTSIMCIYKSSTFVLSSLNTLPLAEPPTKRTSGFCCCCGLICSRHHSVPLNPSNPLRAAAPCSSSFWWGQTHVWGRDFWGPRKSCRQIYSHVACL